eukprot:1139173-Pelagomonas_calceolata.AAC.1
MMTQAGSVVRVCAPAAAGEEPEDGRSGTETLMHSIHAHVNPPAVLPSDGSMTLRDLACADGCARAQWVPKWVKSKVGTSEQSVKLRRSYPDKGLWCTLVFMSDGEKVAGACRCSSNGAASLA